MRDVKKIFITTENCEQIEIPAAYVGMFHVGRIHNEIDRIANVILQTNYSDEVAMEIFKDADKDVYYPFGDPHFDKVSKIKRLTTPDITQINVCYTDGTEDIFVVDYDEGCNVGQLGAPNVNEKVYLSKTGNLYIVIEKGKGINDYFDKDEIDMPGMRMADEKLNEFNTYSMPEMYRYVFLRSGDECMPDFRSALAIRVYDRELGWKFIYKENSDMRIPTPEEWSYPDAGVEEMLRDDYKNTDFSIDAVVRAGIKEVSDAITEASVSGILTPDALNTDNLCFIRDAIRSLKKQSETTGGMDENTQELFRKFMDDNSKLLGNSEDADETETCGSMDKEHSFWDIISDSDETDGLLKDIVAEMQKAITEAFEDVVDLSESAAKKSEDAVSKGISILKENETVQKAVGSAKDTAKTMSNAASAIAKKAVERSGLKKETGKKDGNSPKCDGETRSIEERKKEIKDSIRKRAGEIKKKIEKRLEEELKK